MQNELGFQELDVWNTFVPELAALFIALRTAAAEHIFKSVLVSTKASYATKAGYEKHHICRATFSDE